MEENPELPLDRRHSESQPRPYMYRSVEPDTTLIHPLRRSTDMPRPFQGVAGQLSPRTKVLKFRVYMKLN